MSVATVPACTEECCQASLRAETAEAIMHRTVRSFLIRFSALSALVPASAASQSLPRLEPVECFTEIRGWAPALGVECGWLVVPELRERPDGPTVRLPVVRLRAKEPDGSPPLVYLHGGPGGQGAVRSAARGVFEWPISRHRDVIVYDHRGAGLSEPKLCPDVALEIDRRRENREGDPQERWNGDARECVASMRANGVEPLAYTTSSNVLDLVDLRRVLGYDRWDVYGVSYGGTLVQEAMRYDGSSMRAAVLAYSATPGPAMQAEAALSYQRSLEHLFTSCSAQPSCREAFPTLADDFFTMYDQLEDEPADVTIERTTGPVQVRMDGERYIQDMRCQLSSPRTLRRIPLLVNELRRGDRDAALRVLAGSCGITGFNATIQLVICHAIHGDAYRSAAQEVRRSVRPEFRFMVGENPECELWQERFADPSAHEFVKSDIPTLLLTGEFDERSPTDLSRRIAASLSRSWLFELPGESHGGAVAGCHASILFQFLEEPTRQPDASCIADMPRVVFETQSLTLPTLVLNITSGAGGTESFVGRWEAELPNAPQVVSFDLVQEGGALRGSLRPQEIQVFDGSVEGNRLRFSFRSPDGLRTITFIGELRGDEIAFTREITVPPGVAPGGRWIFGADGVRFFTATRGR